MAAFTYRPQRIYYPRAAGRAQGGGDFQRGWGIGSEIGKALGGLGGAIKSAQQQAAQDAVANQLMNTATPPRAALVSPGYAPGIDTSDPNADLSTDLPQDVSPTIGGAATDTSGGFTPNVIPAGVPTTGTAPITGGVAEMKLRQQFGQSQLADQIQQARLAKLLEPPAGRLGVQPQPGDAGAWSGYNMTQQQPGIPATRGARGQQAQAQPVQIGSEPVTNQSQLVQHFDGTYGKGSFSKVLSNLDTVDTTTTPGYVLAGPTDKQIKVPLGDAQVYVKQMNAIRNRQGLAPLPVPGEDPSLGKDQTNPYPTTNNLDVYSRPPGSWVRLPNGNIAQVPKP
jgi:hypothetical protein